MQGLDVSGSENVLNILHASGRERDEAVWSVCSDVVNSFALYRPTDYSLPKEIASKSNWIQSLHRLAYDALEVAARADQVTFGLYRDSVWNHEASSARKLQVLSWVLQTLYRMRDRPNAPLELIDPLSEKVGDMIVFDWQVAMVPLTGSTRDWATRSTRRYDLLPRSWRYV